MDVDHNPFCAGGMTLGDGTWVVVGGNKAVGAGGVTAQKNASPYYNYNGGRTVRLLSSCSGSGCSWDEKPNTMVKERWYATVEPMVDGHAMLISGMTNGGFVPSSGSQQTSYEFYPNVGGSYNLPLLQRTVPLSLYPLTFLMSSGEVWMQANKEAVLWNTDTLKEKRLPNTRVPRVYPASGAVMMLPLTPANNYQETILLCGGMSLGSAANWGNEGGPATMVTERPASTICEQSSPLVNANWEQVDDLPSGRSMGTFINLPDGTAWFGNGVTTGVAGYTTDPNSPGKPVGTSFADNPELRHYVYDPKKAKGSRFTHVGTASVGRLYHSTATLLEDGSVLIAGSNPSPDVNTKQKWKTTWDVERWYAPYHDKPRPSNAGLPNSFSYGGNAFTLTMDSATKASKAKVVLIRTGFSTHGFNMGQRMLELRSQANGNQLRVAQAPNNPALFAPGPALAFVVVDGVPSIGKHVMVGNGQIGKQPTAANSNLGGTTARFANTTTPQTTNSTTKDTKSTTTTESAKASKSTTDSKSTKASDAESDDADDDADEKKSGNVAEDIVNDVISARAATANGSQSKADAIAKTLQGAPIEGESVTDLFKGFFEGGLQNTVNDVLQEFSDGKLTEHLFGKRSTETFKKHMKRSSRNKHRFGDK